MNDRELLEAAAKAADIAVSWCDKIDSGLTDVYLSDHPNPHWVRTEYPYERWNPLTNDGDALRLAVKLEIDLCFGANYVIANGVQQPTVNNAGDPCVAVRRAITLAAAALALES